MCIIKKSSHATSVWSLWIANACFFAHLPRSASGRFWRNFARIAAHGEGQRRVEFTRSPNRPATPASCALTAAQAKSASASSFSANKYNPSRDVSEPSQPPLNSDYNQRSDLIEAYLDILAAHLPNDFGWRRADDPKRTQSLCRARARRRLCERWQRYEQARRCAPSI
jgi:hypothetical protein